MTRRYMLTQNSELRSLSVFNWTIPALSAALPDGLCSAGLARLEDEYVISLDHLVRPC